MASDELSLSLRIDPAFKVDRGASQLHDLAILTGGREASGHGIYIDQKTVQTAFACAQASGGKLRGAIRHPSLLDALNGNSDRILGMPGFFSDVKIVGHTLVAGTFEFFESFASSEPDTVARILEMAEKTPELFGLSAEPGGKCVWVATDGREFEAKRDPETRKWTGQPKDVALANNGLPTLRVSHLGVAAFVDQPAANDGVFAKLGAMFGGKQVDLSHLRELATSFLAWSARVSGQSPAGNVFVAAPNGNSSAAAPTELQAPDTTMNTLVALKAKYGADKARLSRALEFLAEDPTLSVEGIDAKLAAADQAALQASLATLTQERTDLAAKVTQLTTELAAAKTDAAQWQTKFEAIKASGHSAPLNLSDPTVKASGTAPALHGLARVQAYFKSAATARS